MSVETVHKILSEIRFGTLSPQDIRRLSVVEIQTADTYDENGSPIPSGLMDGRLGTLEPRQRCRTCSNTASRCPGHFGHIELAVPIIHVEFTKIIYDLLRSICRTCGRFLLSPERIEEIKTKLDSIKEMMSVVPPSFYKDVLKEAKKPKRCPHCGNPKYKVKFTKPTAFYEVLEEGAQQLTPSIIRERLERITNEDLALIGFTPETARPEWMILQVIPVPPLYVRPSITLESGIRSEDDLTHKLVDIIRINQRLHENRQAGAPTLIIQDLSELLQYHITTYFNNESSGIPPARHRSGRMLKTLSQRLKGREGRFRQNLSGKRVDFSARTVISPDPNLNINEVGVPIKIAEELTVPEKITHRNLEEMKRLVVRGPDNYPGALYVLRPDGKRIRLEFVSDRETVAEALQPGFVVERHLRDGDVAIFNRQPSLHRMSIMAHFVKVLPYETFRLHLCVCPPYNADFDGDEMNLHVPQSEEAQTEARLLMEVQDQILSPRFGGPIIGATRDFITAAYLLTQKSTLLRKDEMSRMLIATGYKGNLPEPEVTDPDPLWTGKQIFSLFIPKGLNHALKATTCLGHAKCLREKCKHDAYVVVRNGILECGVIDKKSIGAEQSESLLHRIIKDFGTEKGREFLNNVCRLLNNYITIRGFTFSFDELELSPSAYRKITRVINGSEKRIGELIESYNDNTLSRLPGQTLNESFEIYVMNELAEARDKAGRAADGDLDLKNSGIVMTKSGARGSNLNIAQMTACVGQQSVRGKRIMRGYLERALPHFKMKDPSPKARGFVYSSYREGLDPIEFFFHAMGGREGLVDTAVRTQQSGYMQRRLINALEHLRIEYDATVRNSSGDIIQFRYGEDGIDPAKSDHGKAVNVSRLVEHLTISMEQDKPASEEYIKEALEKVEDELTPILLRELRKSMRKAKLTDDGVNQTIKKTVENYRKAFVEPGEAVGAVAAQSIGEPGTQMTLRTFHYAGVREQNVTLGLPRIIEIVDARRNPSTPIMNIHLDKENRESQEGARKVAQRVILTTTKDVSKALYLDPKLEGVIVDLDPAMMENRGITLEDLEKNLQIKNCNLTIQDNQLIVKPTKTIDPKKLLDKVAGERVKGVQNITRVLITEEKGEWVIRTDGSNLSETLEVQNINPVKVTTNHIHEVAKVLGIEAARNIIINEAVSVLEEQGLDVDIRHIMLVADIMTTTGEVRQIGRHGISGEKASVLARAAFEISVSNIIKAAVTGESDPLNGVTENVIVGQSIPVGTGVVDLYMNSAARE